MAENTSNPISEKKSPIIELKNIYFSYDGTTNYVLKDVSFSLYENEYVCIVGSNGSGKSTVSKIITGLIRPNSGELYFLEDAINQSNIKKIRDNIGIIFQNPDNQFIGLTAEDDIAFGLENRKYPRHAIQYTIDLVAREIGITDLLKIESQHMSGGQKQLVAIASILAIKPRVIIFDESTSMLDPMNKEKIKNLMLSLRRLGYAVISITHDMEEVVNADRVIVLHNGILERIGSPKEIFNDFDFLKQMRLIPPAAKNLKELLKKRFPDLSNTLDIRQVVWEICQRIN